MRNKWQQNKRQDTNQHAKIRAFERYGINLTAVKRYDILRQIRSRRAIFVEKQSHTRSVFVVEIDGIKMKVVYNNKAKQLRTVLPMEGGGIKYEK